MRRKINNKDKREVISNIAESILLSGETPRLAADLFWSGGTLHGLLISISFPYG